jgi:hypothetical protein
MFDHAVQEDLIGAKNPHVAKVRIWFGLAKLNEASSSSRAPLVHGSPWHRAPLRHSVRTTPWRGLCVTHQLYANVHFMYTHSFRETPACKTHPHTSCACIVQTYTKHEHTKFPPPHVVHTITHHAHVQNTQRASEVNRAPEYVLICGAKYANCELHIQEN